MPTPRSPSFLYTQDRVDLIADRLLEGKYCKSPPTPESVWNAGLMDNVPQCGVRSYVEKRWRLTPTGTTRRTNSLREKAHRIGNAINRSNPNIVWSARCGYYGGTKVYIMGPAGNDSEMRMLKERVWLMWGWLWMDGMNKSDNVRLEIVGAGGSKELSIRLNEVLAGIEERAQSLQRAAEQANEALAAFGSNAELARGMIQSMQLEALDATVAKL